MRYALFSDIHANWEALETAFLHSKTQKIDRYAVLGDTLGYGANPNECIAWVLEHAKIYVMGNHEKAVWDKALRELFNPMAAEAIEWTEKVLRKDLAARIRDLGYLHIENNLIFTHGNPVEPENFQYLFNYQDAEPSFKMMRCPVCFVGHTHVPACFSEKEKSVSYLKPGILKVDAMSRVILNPGSVGQPRDQDPRLAYGIYDDKKQTFEIVRLEYDNQRAAKKIRDAGLPGFLADRLF